MSEPPEQGDEEVYEGRTASFRLTEAFLRRHPRYRQLLSLTPEHYRFDPVLWNSSVATLRGLLRAVAVEEGLPVAQAHIEEAVRNLTEGVVARSGLWRPGKGKVPPDES